MPKHLSRFVGHSSLLDQGPKDSVVQVVDMAVRLSPGQVVPHVAHSWIENSTAVEGGRMFQLSVREEIAPMEDIGRRKQRRDC